MHCLPSPITKGRPSLAVPTRRALRTFATDGDGTLGPGTKVRVNTSVIVYHVPKKDALDIQGLEGEISSDVRQFKGTDLTANLPWRVKLEMEKENGKKSKFFAHLRDDEFDVIE